MRSFYVINSGRFKRQDNTIVFIDYEEKKKPYPLSKSMISTFSRKWTLIQASST
ncbi:hypothetical protein SAMN06265361_10295 [Laceyella tengchongensis]|uniref:Uncharacterized protein n=1 Tax=Laceyella tengchongensis TaxID=574699 RepID=A0AA46ADZ3_9BACL|nr:hypothetical protein SAMN06265361_10295 [Laceyella tengchongensis]